MKIQVSQTHKTFRLQTFFFLFVIVFFVETSTKSISKDIFRNLEKSVTIKMDLDIYVS